MHTADRLKHSHRFHSDNRKGERGTYRVIVLTGIMMIIEIIAGLLTNSMALLADGWHMCTHMAALGIAAFAYYLARRHADDKRYSFGTGKIGTLGGFASAVFLAVVALLMAGESIHRFFSPLEIDFNMALLVAASGLIVNLVSAGMLKDHSHDGHHDHNLKAAYLHVLADALTSVTAIVALLAGKLLGWVWMDPIMGIVGAAVICVWSYGLLRQTGAILLDRQADPKTISRIREILECDSECRIADLHIWRVGSHHLSAIVCIVTHSPKPPAYYKDLLCEIPDLDHIAVEVNACSQEIYAKDKQ